MTKSFEDAQQNLEEERARERAEREKVAELTKKTTAIKSGSQWPSRKELKPAATDPPLHKNTWTRS